MTIYSSIIGIGRTLFGEHYERDPEDLIEEAGLNALINANIERKDIEAIYVSDYFLQITNKIGIEEGFLAELLDLNIPMERFRSFSSALMNACLAIHSGRYNVVLVGGVEKISDRLDKIRDDLMMLCDPWTYHSGGAPESNHELMLREYVKTYNIKNELYTNFMKSLAYISVKNHKFGARNKYAQFYGREIKVEDVFKARNASKSILGMYDYAPPITGYPSDGATTIIITNPSSAHEYSNKPVHIIGLGSATDYISYTSRPQRIGFKSVKLASSIALNDARVSMKDIQVAELYDQSTIMEAVLLEDLGFCNNGKSWEAIYDSYINSRLYYECNGKALYVNTNGGLKADGNPLGALGGAQIFEVVSQLRGESGDRQVKVENELKYGLTVELEGFGTKAYVFVFRGD